MIWKDGADAKCLVQHQEKSLLRIFAFLNLLIFIIVSTKDIQSQLHFPLQILCLLEKSRSTVQLTAYQDGDAFGSVSPDNTALGYPHHGS